MSTALENFQAAPVQYVDLDGTRVAYRRFGSGPAILFIHGWPLRGATYRELVAALQGDFTCWVPDLPGAGDTPWSPAIAETFHGYAELMERFVKTVGLEEFGLVAHDSGGTVARLLAARLPERVFGIALTNTEVAGHAVPLVPMLQAACKMPGASWILARLLGLRSFVHSRFGFRGVFADRSLLDGEFDQVMLEPLRRDASGARVILAKADLGVVDGLDQVELQCRAPLLALWGARDPFFPLQGAREMVERWPAQATLEVIEDGKLFVHEEHHRELAGPMRTFFGRAATRRVADPLSA